MPGRPSAQIRAAEPRKQKHDRCHADLILKLLAEDLFPAIWLPSQELLDLRALLLHRHQWVRLRTRIQNALQAIALANGLRRGPSGCWPPRLQRSPWERFRSLRQEGTAIARISTIAFWFTLPTSIYFLWSPITDFLVRRRNLSIESKSTVRV